MNRPLLLILIVAFLLATAIEGKKKKNHHHQKHNKNMCKTADYCKNGGTCVKKGKHENCLCKEGFSGSKCENELEKQPSPRMNASVSLEGHELPNLDTLINVDVEPEEKTTPQPQGKNKKKRHG
ncbi:hypothetical protein CAPTEDRAFT_195582 [Capitella teleta]|uniref:EGF-like domain-containing protein n=1 Tax=Capitella teleta TaxID=283909 RepID=R7UAN3_CAPTE|nr:hypothetical protein CAPTEDRAFT_195582 [Capitella teleta]|eukprot:ELU03191.1 hypothetical protein CAPTEDRAFT_195582 [Capitella teleta]